MRMLNTACACACICRLWSAATHAELRFFHVRFLHSSTAACARVGLKSTRTVLWQVSMPRLFLSAAMRFCSFASGEVLPQSAGSAAGHAWANTRLHSAGTCSDKLQAASALCTPCLVCRARAQRRAAATLPGRQAAWPKLPSCSGKRWKGQSVAQRCSVLAGLAGAVRQADKPVWSLARPCPVPAISCCLIQPHMHSTELGLFHDRENGLENVPKC